MYHDDRLDAYPKGEIFLGNQLDGYSVRIGVSATSAKNQGYPFTLFTPERIYNLSCATEQERDEWISIINSILSRPLTPQDSSGELTWADDDYNYYIFLLLFSWPKIHKICADSSFAAGFPTSPSIHLLLFYIVSIEFNWRHHFSQLVFIFVQLFLYVQIINTSLRAAVTRWLLMVVWFIEDNTSNTNQCHKYSPLFYSIF